MRILYATAHYPPDFVSGATLQVQRLAQRTSRAGHDVAVFSGAIAAGLADGATRRGRLDGVDMQWIGTAGLVEQDDDRNWRNPAATAAVADLIDAFAPDVVHAHTLQTLGTGPVTEATRRGIPTIVTMHDLWWWCARLFLVDRDLRPCRRLVATSDCPCAKTAEWRRRRAAALLPALDDVEQILVPSRSMYELVIANGLSPDKVEVDENDVEVPAATTGSASATSPANADGRHRDRHPRVGASDRPNEDDDRRVRFLYIGGPSPLKGADVMLAAAARLLALGGWSLEAYGITPPSNRPLRSLIDRVGDAIGGRFARRRPPIAHRPAFPPSETGAVLAAADVLVIPSIARESFSIAAREALAAGLPVITSDCLGPEEVVRHGVNGLVVPTGDAAALADAMRELVDDRELLDRLRRGANDSPVTLRDPDEHAASLLDRYQRLIGAAG